MGRKGEGWEGRGRGRKVGNGRRGNGWEERVREGKGRKGGGEGKVRKRNERRCGDGGEM